MQYSGYTVVLSAGEDAPTAETIGENFKSHFGGADYEVEEDGGSVPGQCHNVRGRDRAVCQQMKDWINARL